MTHFRRTAALLGISAVMAFGCMTAAISTARGEQTVSKTVLVKRHTRIDLKGIHQVGPYYKTTKTLKVSGYTYMSKDGRTIKVKGYHRNVTQITPVKLHHRHSQ